MQPGGRMLKGSKEDRQEETQCEKQQSVKASVVGKQASCNVSNARAKSSSRHVDGYMALSFLCV